MGYNKIQNIDATVLGGVSAGLYRNPPWHGMGEITDNKGRTLGIKRPLEDDVREATTIRALADLEWEPTQWSLNGFQVGINSLVSDRKILVRDGWPEAGQSYELGVHSEKYGMLSNEVGVDFIATILSLRSDAKLRSVTTLYGGKIIFGVIEFVDEVQVTRRDGTKLDKHTPFMGVYWSHDGSHPLGVKYMRHEWVCENTFTPWNAETGLVVRHTRHARDRASDALAAINKMMIAMDAFDHEVERLLQIELDRDQFKGILRSSGLLGKRPDKDGRTQTNYDNRFNAIVAEWDEFTTQANAYDLVMAVQGYEQHRQTVRGGGRDVKTIGRILRDSYPLTQSAAKTIDRIYN